MSLGPGKLEVDEAKLPLPLSLPLDIGGENASATDEECEYVRLLIMDEAVGGGGVPYEPVRFLGRVGTGACISARAMFIGDDGDSDRSRSARVPSLGDLWTRLSGSGDAEEEAEDDGGEGRAG